MWILLKKLPFVSMSASDDQNSVRIQVPGEGASFAQRLMFAIETSGYRGKTAVETALMMQRPDLFKFKGFITSYTGSPGKPARSGKKYPDPKLVKAISELLHVSFEWLIIGSGPLRPVPDRINPATSGEHRMTLPVAVPAESISMPRRRPQKAK